MLTGGILPWQRRRGSRTLARRNGGRRRDWPRRGSEHAAPKRLRRAGKEVAHPLRAWPTSVRAVGRGRCGAAVERERRPGHGRRRGARDERRSRHRRVPVAHDDDRGGRRLRGWGQVGRNEQSSRQCRDADGQQQRTCHRQRDDAAAAEVAGHSGPETPRRAGRRGRRRRSHSRRRMRRRRGVAPWAWGHPGRSRPGPRRTPLLVGTPLPVIRRAAERISQDGVRLVELAHPAPRGQIGVQVRVVFARQPPVGRFEDLGGRRLVDL